MTRPRYGTVIVGGGPAGLAPLVAASREGRLDDLLAAGVAVVERGPALGAGRLGRYAITSDSTAETFLTAVAGHADPRLGTLLETPLCRDLQSHGRNAVPLAKAGALMDAIGAVLATAIVEAGGAILVGHEARRATQAEDGSWRVSLRRLADGASIEITGDAVLLATGGDQSIDRLGPEPVAGRPLVPAYSDKLVLSDEVLRSEGVALVRQRLALVPEPKIAIVGGSTSALAAAALLLRELPVATRAAGSITILHRRPLRVFYPSAEAALADGYDEFGPTDICPLSGFVFRLAGFRLESRDLLMRIRQIGGRTPEHRVALHRIGESEDGASHAVLEQADLVVAALGYRPRSLPVFGSNGREIMLRGRVSKLPLVDEVCRVCDEQGRPVSNLFGVGLAAGFVPRGKLGGEPSFVGQANGLWLWQTAVGTMILDGLSRIHAEPPAPLPALAAILAENAAIAQA